MNYSVPAIRMAKPPAIDGKIEAGEWPAAAKFSGLVDLGTGQRAEDGGEFWLGYDDRYIYFAARLEDRQPAKIAANEYKTNVDLSADDTVLLSIDPFGNLTDFSQFTINPRGATSVFIAGGRAVKREWLGEFQAAGRVTATGWEVEARIPWGIMRLPARGARDVRIQVARNQARLQGTYVWADVTNGRVQNYGHWTGVELPASPRPSIKFLPYTYAGAAQGDKPIFNTGLDVRTNLTDRLDAVGSVNPDFRNVENNILSLDFSYYRRIAGESRPFFLEGASFFRSSLDAPIFLSQQIPNFDVGFKTFGKLNDHTNLGVLEAGTFDRQNSFAAELNQAIDDHTTFQAAVADMRTPTISNDATFFQYRKQVGTYSGFGQISTTQDSQQGFGHRVNFGSTYLARGMNGLLEYSEVSSQFLPRLGYAPQVGYRGVDGDWGVFSRSSRGAVLETEFDTAANYDADFSGSLFREDASASYTVLFRDRTNVAVNQSFDVFRGNHDRVTSIQIQRPQGDPYRSIGVNYAFGRELSMPYRLLDLTVSGKPIRTLQISADLSTSRQVGQNLNQTIVTFNYDLGRDRALSARAVRQGSKTNAFLAYSRAGNRGMEYFVILGDPNSLTFSRSLIFKVVFPFETGR